MSCQWKESTLVKDICFHWFSLNGNLIGLLQCQCFPPINLVIEQSRGGVKLPNWLVRSSLLRYTKFTKVNGLLCLSIVSQRGRRDLKSDLLPTQLVLWLRHLSLFSVLLKCVSDQWEGYLQCRLKSSHLFVWEFDDYLTLMSRQVTVLARGVRIPAEKCPQSYRVPQEQGGSSMTRTSLHSSS